MRRRGLSEKLDSKKNGVLEDIFQEQTWPNTLCNCFECTKEDGTTENRGIIASV